MKAKAVANDYSTASMCHHKQCYTITYGIVKIAKRSEEDPYAGLLHFFLLETAFVGDEPVSSGSEAKLSPKRRTPESAANPS